MAFERFENDATTSLTANVNIIQTTISVLSATKFPAFAQYRIKINDEIILVTGGAATTTWTVVRGAEGSVAQTHLSGDSVTHVLTRDSLARAIRGDVAFGEATGSANAYDVVISPVPISYEIGMKVHFKANFSNTGAATVNLNSLGAKDIKKNVSSDLSSGDIAVDEVVLVVYDGTNFQLISSSPLQIFYNEVPSGTLNGVNKTFTLSSGFTTGTTRVYLNGLRQLLGTSYTESSPQVIFDEAPLSSDEIVVDYEAI